MADVPVPQEIQDWMTQLGWPEHHDKWHAERQWDRQSLSARQAAAARGWHRVVPQEGAPGNGLDFLFMHRAMLVLLRERFPQHAAYFVGWSIPPFDPDDPIDPVPPANPQPFSAEMRRAVDRLQQTGLLAGIASEDELGLFIETRARPTPQNPFATATEPRAGIHNYLHNRFSAPGPIDMGMPSRNLFNARFWKLHGWIDARWSAYRASQHLSDTDPAYLAQLQAAQHHLLGHETAPHHLMTSAHESAALLGASSVPPPLPQSLQNPFRETLATRFQSLMHNTPEIHTLDELKAYLQTALELELYTLPLYLTATWSIHGASEVPDIILSIAMQEMLHMGLVCNLLKGIGGTPDITSVDAVPIYPSQPPGIDLPDYDLQAFSAARVQQFMDIEQPENPIPPVLLEGMVQLAGHPFKTIGEFYDTIDRGLDTVHATGGLVFDVTQQLARFISGDQMYKIPDLAKAHEAVQLIKLQGEGTTLTQSAGPGVLAHYYRFEQILLQMKYVEQADGTWKLDPSQQLPMPSVTDVYAMAPIPAGGYPGVPEADAFDSTYTAMLDDLERAWNGGGVSALTQSIAKMRQLQGLANILFEKDAPSGGKYGPTFRRFVAPPPVVPPSVPPVAAGMSYQRVKDILDEAVNHDDFGAHGAFWRTLSRDQFVAKSIFGRKLLAETAPGVFDPNESNLVKALEGREPFGADLTPVPAGAVFNRMPDGYDPVPQSKIDEIRAWIAAGCPEVAALPAPAGGLEANLFAAAGPLVPDWIDVAAGGPIGFQTHLDFWRNFDNVFMFEVTDPVSEDINTFFGITGLWLAAAKNVANLPAWEQALTDAAVRQAIERLAIGQRDVIVASYGRPAPLLTLLDGWERFGDGTLPPDAQRPGDPHQMNGRIMWFMWSAFVDACLRLTPVSPDIPREFWEAIARCVLVGLANDGVFRGRFPVQGFAPTADGKAAILERFRTLAATDLLAELATRYAQSGL